MMTQEAERLVDRLISLATKQPDSDALKACREEIIEALSSTGDVFDDIRDAIERMG
jgi:hypothetical protein